MGQSLIPCLGGTVQDPTLTPPAGDCDPSVTEFVSDFVDYTITEDDAEAGLAVALARYQNGLLHINANNLPDAANGSTPIPTRVMFCPPDTECVESFCDEEADDGMRLGLCRTLNRDDSTPCTDTDGNPCTMAGCEAGSCVQSHMTVDCSGECLSGACDPTTGACLPAPDSTTCADTDGNVCTTAGCEAGVCVQQHLLAPNSTVCPDTDGNSCTMAGCEAGTCVQRHVLAGDSIPCADTDGNPCTTAGCEAGVCVQRHMVIDCSGECESGVCDPVLGCIPLPDSTPCTDRDGTLCTVAGCEAGVCVQDHLSASGGLPDCGPLPTGPCVVTIGGRPGSFTSLQAAINAAPNGATINVTGLCPGPVSIDGRDGLVIQGPTPVAGACPAADLLPSALGAAVEGSDSTVLKIRDSRDIVVRFLKIVNGPGACVKLTRAVESTLNCSCVAGCGLAGVEVTDARMSEISQSLVKTNGDDGLALFGGTTANTITANTIELNGDDGIDLEGSGNDILGNVIRANGHDGIDADNANDNRIVGNSVLGNGCLPSASTDSGIEVKDSDDNEIDANVIQGNGDGLVDQIHCRSGSSGNFGSNVPPKSPCR
jgi:parallel beta-helix repeat protein